jgi:hypothetical protein
MKRFVMMVSRSHLFQRCPSSRSRGSEQDRIRWRARLQLLRPRQVRMVIVRIYLRRLSSFSLVHPRH